MTSICILSNAERVNTRRWQLRYTYVHGRCEGGFIGMVDGGAGGGCVCDTINRHSHFAGIRKRLIERRSSLRSCESESMERFKTRKQGKYLIQQCWSNKTIG